MERNIKVTIKYIPPISISSKKKTIILGILLIAVWRRERGEKSERLI